MQKNTGKTRAWSKTVCILLLLGSLLLSGCATSPSGPEETDDTPPPPTQTPETPNPSPVDRPAPSGSKPEDASLVSLRQAMTETPQRFAAAFFGNVPQDGNPFTVMQEAAPQLCEDLPFLLTIEQDHILGVEGQLFCIVPADENATVAVNRVKWNAETESYECTDVIYRSESGDPLLLMCNSSGQEPDTEIVITDTDGNAVIWYPYLEISYTVATLYNSNAESLLFDFTSYEELPVPDQNQGIDCLALVGTWERAWTEVEGDRNEAVPGAYTIEITADGTDSFRMTYTDRDFPDENFSDRELSVVPGELYPGCSNDQGIAEVVEEAGDTYHYALTLQEDGTLLLQTGWEMDGIPMVSYGCYKWIA